MPGPLNGHTALVTGATGGLGSAIASRLAADGATVALAHLDDGLAAAELAAHITGSGGAAISLAADLRDAEAVRALCHQAHDQLGPVDILVSNAGAYPRCTWTETTPAHWDAALASNLTSHYLLAHELTPAMTAAGGAGSSPSAQSSPRRAATTSPATSVPRPASKDSPVPSHANSAQSASPRTVSPPVPSASPLRTPSSTTRKP